MKVVITGAAGFIGSSLADRMIIEGHQVLAIDMDFRNPYAERNSSRLNQRAEIFETDLSSLETSLVAHQVRRVESFAPDLVVHLAGLAGVRESVLKREKYITTNSVSTARACEFAARCSVPILAASTSSLYKPKVGPTNESDPIEVRHPYALSKQLSELILSGYSETTGLQALALRFFTVFGSYGRRDMLPGMLIRSAVSGDSVTLFDTPMKRDWTYIEDLVDRIILLSQVSITNRQAGSFEVVNVGSGRPITVQEFVSIFQEIAERPINIIPAVTPPTEAKQTWADITKLESYTGKLVPRPLAEALAQTWQWALSMPPHIL